MNERILDDGLRRRRHVRWTVFVQIPVSVEASRAEERGSAKLHFRYRSIGVVGIEANATDIRIDSSMAVHTARIIDYESGDTCPSDDCFAALRLR